MDTFTIVIAVLAILVGVVGLVIIAWLDRRGQDEVMIKNIRYRQFDEPVKNEFDYSQYYDGIRDDE